MNLKKPLLAAGIAGVIGATALTGLHSANADTGNGQPFSNLAAAIAERFNLNQEEVQQVFDEQHKQMEGKRQEMMQEHLNEAVSSGTITQEQADLITAKHNELESQRESLKDKTPQERQEAMKANRDEFKQWAEDNNIPLDLLGGPGGPGHHGHGMRMGPHSEDSSN